MKLQEVCDVYSGYALKEFHDDEEGYPVIKIGNICSDGTLDLGKCQFTNDLVNEKYFSKKGDIYVALSGATTGKIGIISTDDKYIINQRVGIVRKMDDNIPDQYIKYFLMNKTEKILEDASGCAQPNISPKQIGQYEFPEVGYSEMNNISAILDRVSNVITQRKQELQKLDELIKSRFIELFGDPETNPLGLEKVLLSDIAEYFNGLTYSPDNVTNDGTIVLRSSNIQNSQLDFADTVRVNSSIKDKLFVKDNDILMCSRNGSARLVGKVALIKNLSEPMTFGAFMMIIRSRYYPYLMTYFQMDAFRRQIATGATTTINQITGNMLNKISLPLPDMADINEFAAFVEQVDKSKVKVQQSLDEAQILMDSLMQKYFG